MNMFRPFLDSLPKNRSEIVNEFDADDVSLPPFVWTEAEFETDVSLSTTSDTAPSGSCSIDEYEAKNLSTDSSISLSRAMTDSEIDYGRYRRLKSRSFSDPWDQMRATLDAFPPGYLSSMSSFQDTSSALVEDSTTTDRSLPPYRNEDLLLKMERFFDEECRIFTPDDPGLLELEEALQSIDLKTLDTDSDSTVP